MAPSRRNVFFVAVFVSLLNLSPLFFAKPGADVLFHYALIDCYGRQFWQGDFYPRWCMEANNGLGSPAPLFYSPLPYLIAALLYPLHGIGLNVEGIYLCLLGLAGVATLLTCRAWLCDFVSPGRALLCAALFLFMPYRMELMLFRSAFAELWCLAWMPLLFLNARKLAQQRPGGPAGFGLSLTLCLLTHVPATLIALLACGIYMLFLSDGLKPKLHFALAILPALTASSFYLLPAHFFFAYLDAGQLELLRNSWVNRTLQLADFTEFGRMRILINSALTALLVVSLAIIVYAKRAQLPEPFVKRELLAWLLIACISTLLLFPLSAPFWALLMHVTPVVTPWRAQLLLSFALVYLLALKMQFFMSPKQLTTWKGDYAGFALLLGFLTLFIVTVRPPETEQLFVDVIHSHIVVPREYRTIWTDEAFATIEHMMAQSPAHEAHITQGEGHVAIADWNASGIRLSTDITKDSTIELTHLYFPIWRATIDGADRNTLSAQPHNGLMALRVPAGKHAIVIKRDLAASMGYSYWSACIASFAALVLLAVFACKSRRPADGL